MMTRLLLLSSLLLLSVSMSAQEFVNVMEDSMYDSGRINVVLGVVAIIFIFFFVYLIRLDKKIGKMERELKD